MKNANVDKDLSVHLSCYPQITYEPKKDIIAKMDAARELCSKGLSLRKKHNLRTRLPLESIKIFGYEQGYFDELQDIIESELNVKNIIYLNESHVKVSSSVKLNFKTIGAKFGINVAKITTAVKQGDFKINTDGTAVAADFTLLAEDFEVVNSIDDSCINKQSEDWFGFNDTCDSSFKIIILCIKVSPELELEAMARDFVRAVQSSRKSLNLDVSAQINLSYWAEGEVQDLPKLNTAIDLHRDYIKSQTITQNLIFCNKPLQDSSFSKTIATEVDGINLKMQITI